MQGSPAHMDLSSLCLGMAFKAASYVTLRFVPASTGRVLSAAERGFRSCLPVCPGSASDPSILTLVSFSRLFKLGCCSGGGTPGVSCALRRCVCVCVCVCVCACVCVRSSAQAPAALRFVRCILARDAGGAQGTFVLSVTWGLCLFVMS